MQLLPEIILTIFIILLLILHSKKAAFPLSIVGVIGALVGVFFATNGEIFYGSFVSNNFTDIFRVIILSGTLITILLARNYIKIAWEFYVLLLTASLGAMLLSGANDLIMVFIALETLSISSFALTGFLKNKLLSTEAGLKYLIFGAVSTGIMLYGFSFIYGLTGETNFNLIQITEQNLILIVAFIMVLAGFGYKIAAVPFHAWSPDVYEGAPLPVAAYLSVVSKAAGFAALIKIVMILFNDSYLFAIIIATIAVITMTVGNLMALNQQNIRRLMAYSSIAHAGYVLLGISLMTYEGISAIIFYLITYLFMNFGVWAAIEIFAIITGKENIDDYNGLSFKHRYFALGLTVCLLSLAGIPITAGFFSKFYLFTAITLAGYNYIPLLIIALINTIIALFYYMRIVKALYVQPEDKVQYIDITSSPFVLRAILAVTVAGVVLIGIFAAPIIDIARQI